MLVVTIVQCVIKPRQVSVPVTDTPILVLEYLVTPILAVPQLPNPFPPTRKIMSPRNKEDDLTQEILKKYLSYDPNTGLLVWIIPLAYRHQPGDIAGSLDSSGYLRVSIFNRNYWVHRIIWLHYYGVWPTYEIDHINRIKSDNRIDNLRDVLPTMNQRNRSVSTNNTSGYSGVSYISQSLRWRVQIQVDGKRLHIGTFHSKEQAIEARRKAEIKYGFIGE